MKILDVFWCHFIARMYNDVYTPTLQGIWKLLKLIWILTQHGENIGWEGQYSRGNVLQRTRVKTHRRLYPEKKAKVKVAQLSIKSAHAVRWSLKLFSLCQSLFLISAHLEDVLTYLGRAHAVPFDYKQPVLIVMIKRDLTHQCPSLNRARSHLARLSVTVCGGNEEASPEAISESIITRAVSATAKASTASNSVN